MANDRMELSRAEDRLRSALQRIETAADVLRESHFDATAALGAITALSGSIGVDRAEVVATGGGRLAAVEASVAALVGSRPAARRKATV